MRFWLSMFGGRTSITIDHYVREIADYLQMEIDSQDPFEELVKEIEGYLPNSKYKVDLRYLGDRELIANLISSIAKFKE